MSKMLRILVCTALILSFSVVAFPASKQIKIGSKNTVDHVVLGKALFFYLKVHSLPVVDRTNLGDSMDSRRAILVGNIDLYFESLSTAWFNYFHKKSIETSPDYLYLQCKKIDEKNNLHWLPYAPANRTLAIVMKKFDCNRLNIHSISAWARYISNRKSVATIVLPKELQQSKTLLDALVSQCAKKLNLKGDIPYRTLEVTHWLVPNLIGNGSYFSGMTFTSLGKIDCFELECLKDDVKFFPAYNLCPVAREEILLRYPRLPFLLNMFSRKVTTDAMRRFDYLVSEKKKNPERIAKAWLIDKKLVSFEQASEYFIEE